MVKKNNKITVPGGLNDPPFEVTGYNLLTVANWILKGVQKAHHVYPFRRQLLQHFCRWNRFPAHVVVPQYQVPPLPHRRGFGDFNGEFNMELRKVCWSRDDFVRLCMKKIANTDGAVARGCQGLPSFTTIATDELRSWDECPGFEYFFRLVWLKTVPRCPPVFREFVHFLPANVVHIIFEALGHVSDPNFEVYDIKVHGRGVLSWCHTCFFAKLPSVSYVSSDLGVMMDYAVDRPKCFTVPDHLWHELAVIKKRKQSKKWQGDPDALLNCRPAGGLKNKGSPNFRWQERDGIATVLPRETVYFNSLLPAMTAMTPRRFAGCSTQTAGVDMESPTRPPEGEARDPLRECREVSRQIREARNAEKARLRNAEKSRLRAMAWPKPPPPPIPPWFR